MGASSQFGVTISIALLIGSTSMNLLVATWILVAYACDKCNLIQSWSGEGSGDLSQPDAVAVDNIGNVYVADAGRETTNSVGVKTQNTRVEKFTADGQFITEWSSHGSANDGQLIAQWRLPETGPQWGMVMGMGVDSAGNVYTAVGGFVMMSGSTTIARTNGYIDKFASDGTLISRWALGDQSFSPTGIATDSRGDVYVPSEGYVVKFDSSGNVLTQWSVTGASAVAVDSHDNVYVIDPNRRCVTEFGDSSQQFADTSLPYGLQSLPNLSDYVMVVAACALAALYFSRHKLSTSRKHNPSPSKVGDIELTKVQKMKELLQAGLITPEEFELLEREK